MPTKTTQEKPTSVTWWPQRVENKYGKIALLIYALIYKQYSYDLHKLAVNLKGL